MAQSPEFDPAAFQRWLRDPGGPVMRDLLPKLGAEVTAAAKARIHSRTGATAASVHWHVDCDSQGPYCDVGGSYVFIFLEKPAEQMHSPHRYLTGALRDVAARRQ